MRETSRTNFLSKIISLQNIEPGCWEPPGVAGEGAGYLSPRQMVRAQQRIAAAGGCHVIRELAVDLVRGEAGAWEVLTDTGARLTAEKAGK